MATQRTADALIDLNMAPIRQRANVGLRQTQRLVSISNRATAKNVAAFTSKDTEIKNSIYTNLSVHFNSGSPGETLIFNNARILGAMVTGNSLDQELQIGNGNFTTVNPMRADLGDGNDSIVFSQRATTIDSGFNMGRGADSVTFAKLSTTRNTVVDLGADNDADRLNIIDLAKVAALNINSFGRQDTLRVGTRTYTYDDIAQLNGRVSNAIRVNIDARG
jgi:hypothetical protein